MKWIVIFLFAFYLHCICAQFDNKLLQTFESVTDVGLVSESCQDALKLYIDNLNETSSWSIRMLDATSKVPVGIFSLNFGELGQFSECLATQSQDGLIQPKYCLGGLPLNKLFNSTNTNSIDTLHQHVGLSKALRVRTTAKLITLQDGGGDGDDNNQGIVSSSILWAICLPSDCKDDDVALILDQIMITLTSCQVREDLNPPLTGGAITTIVILSIFALLLVLSTGIDIYFKFYRKESPHILFLAFSVYANGQKLFRISRNTSEMSCLNGIRVWSMIWVIIGHTYSLQTGVPIFNYMDILTWVDTWRSMTIVSGTLAVDTFLFLAGLLVVYSYLKAKHHGVKFNIFQFYIHRYLRLTPALAVLILVTATLLRYMGSGPVWKSVLSTETSCQKYWWTTLLYIQNYANEDMNLCLGHSWYLSVDMQLYVISPLILLPLWKYPKVALSIIGAGVVTFIIVPFTIAYINELPGLAVNYEARVSILEYMKLYYLKTHGRAAPWFIGLLLGYVLAKIKFEGDYKYLTLNKVVVLGSWGACLAVMLTCVYGGHSTLMGPDYSVWASSLYIALLRPAWAVCLAWMIFACESGYGGPINWFLSFPIYQVLGRFTYSLYLVHYPLLTILVFMAKSGIYFSELYMTYTFWGITMFSFGLAFVWVLAFESPIVVLEKVLFGGGIKKSKQGENGTKVGANA